MQENKNRLRVALLGIYHESNTFLRRHTLLTDFENGHLFTGAEILKEYGASHHEIAGMLEVLTHYEVEVLPVMFAEATPGGIISADTFNSLMAEMMRLLEKVLPIDGCLVVPHGAAVSEEFGDMDGHWLSLIRNRLGEIPIVGTLDPHANVSDKMIAATDALIAYGTNPHVDQKETGKKAAELLVKMLKEDFQVVQELVQVPLAISIEQQNTAVEPCRSLYEYAGTLVEKYKLLTLSVILGFPYADVPEMGSSFIAIWEGRGEKPALSKALLEYMLTNQSNFAGQKKNVDTQLLEIENSPKPVLLLDMGDNVGGGAEGDSFFLLEKLEAEYTYKVFGCIYDPLAVKQAAQHSLESKFNLSFGQSQSSIPIRQYHTEITLLQLADGRFKEELPRHGGQANYDMGQIAIVATQKGNIVMLMSKKIPPFSLSQLTSFGIMPEDFDVIIAKGVNAPIAAYGSVCRTIIQVNTPGVTQADMTLFTYHKRRRPLNPFELL